MNINKDKQMYTNTRIFRIIKSANSGANDMFFNVPSISHNKILMGILTNTRTDVTILNSINELDELQKRLRETCVKN